MYEENLINLDMKLNNDNDLYYIQKLDQLIYNSENSEIIAKPKNIKYNESNERQKGCFEWFCELIFGCQKEENQNEIHKEIPHFVGLINIGNNCYLNAGLQILSRCYLLLKELLKNNYEKDELINLLVETMVTLLFKKDKYYNPSKFVHCFCKRNKEFISGRQNCSQDFIRTILRNINEIFEKKINYKDYHPENKDELNAYKTYILKNNIFPESKPYSIFNGMMKIHVNGICSNCNKEINDYSFSSFVDQILYLDSFSTKCRFSDVLRKNISKGNKASMKCQNCKEKIQVESDSKFIKLPEIFIFTLERYLVRNRVPVEPDEFIDVYDLTEESLKLDKYNCKYELFAVNIRLGNDISSGHEICHIKENNIWYTINDKEFHIKSHDYNESSYGLFYRKMRNDS